MSQITYFQRKYFDNHVRFPESSAISRYARPGNSGGTWELGSKKILNLKENFEQIN